MSIALAQTKNQMLVVDHARRRDRFHFARQEERLRIAVSKRLQHLVPAQELNVELGKRQLVVELQARLQGFLRQQFGSRSAKRFSKQMELLFAQRHSGRHLVSAIFFKNGCAPTQGLNQIQSLDASATPLACSLFVKPHNNRGSMIFAGEARGDDAQHSGCQPRPPATMAASRAALKSASICSIAALKI